MREALAPLELGTTVARVFRGAGRSLRDVLEAQAELELECLGRAMRLESSGAGS